MRYLKLDTAVFMSRHPDRFGPPPGAAGDGGQDADTAQGLPPPEPEWRSAEALRSAGDHEVGVVEQPVDGGGGEGLGHDRIEANRGWHMFWLIDPGWCLGYLPSGVSAGL